MAKKRKLETKSVEAARTHQRYESKRQQKAVEEQQLEDQEPMKQVEEIPEEEEEEEEVEEEEEGEEEEEEEEEEVELEEDDEEEEEEEENETEDDTENGDGKKKTFASTRTSAAKLGRNNDDDADEEPLKVILEPFSKEQLIDLILEVADKHVDVADQIRKVADEETSHRKIFVHGLGWDTNADTLWNAFKDYGEIEDWKVVMDKSSGKSKGYGFVLFKRWSGARRALKQPQKRIGNRMTACQLASIGPIPSAAAGAVSQGVPPQQPVSDHAQRKIFVSNVGAGLDPQKVLNFFSRYGEIEEGPIGLDKHTGKPKGFCLFVYKTIEGAKKALEEPHKNFEGHILHCQKAIEGPKSNKQRPYPNQGNQNKQFQRSDDSSFVGSTAGPGHLIAPAVAGMPFNQGPAAAQALNPALGQALTALLTTQGAGLGLTNLLGSLGAVGMGGVVNPAVAGAGPVVQGGYLNQGVGVMNPAVMGGYGNQVGYQNQQMGQGGSVRPQHGVGHMPYMGQ